MTTLLVDGLMLVHRSHRGMPDLTTESGIPTGMEYGFMRSLLALLKRFEVDRTVICWDAPAASRKRRKAHPAYKANRTPSTKEDAQARASLYKRADHLRNTVLSQIFPWALEPGCEADDLMFAISRADGTDSDYLIYTNDADLLQAVDGDRVMQVKSHESKLYVWDTDKVLEKYGVRPHQLPLLRAVLGDPSDNLPGCNVFGKGKTADYVRDAYRMFAAQPPAHHNLPEALIFRVLQDANVEGYWSDKKIRAWQEFVDTGMLALNYETMILRPVSVRIHAPGGDEKMALEQLRAWEIRSLRFPDGMLEGALCEEEEF